MSARCALDATASLLEEGTSPLVGLDDPDGGWGLGLRWALLRDPAVLGLPHSVGTLTWVGAYGHSRFVDPQERPTVLVLTNTTPEGVRGRLPAEVRDATHETLPA